MFGDVFDSMGLDGDDFREHHDHPATAEEARENIKLEQELHDQAYADGITARVAAPELYLGAYIFAHDGWVYCGFGQSWANYKSFETLYRVCENRAGLDPAWVYEHRKEGEVVESL